jgi:hypothetical protein
MRGFGMQRVLNRPYWTDLREAMRQLGRESRSRSLHKAAGKGAGRRAPDIGVACFTRCFLHQRAGPDHVLVGEALHRYMKYSEWEWVGPTHIVNRLG